MQQGSTKSKLIKQKDSNEIFDLNRFELSSPECSDHILALESRFFLYVV